MPKKKRKQSLFTQAKLKVFRSVAFTYRTGDIGASGILRFFSIKLYVAPIEEMYTVSDCHQDITMKSLKSRLEIMVGIPVNFQRLQYLDESKFPLCKTAVSNLKKCHRKIVLRDSTPFPLEASLENHVLLSKPDDCAVIVIPS